MNGDKLWSLAAGVFRRWWCLDERQRVKGLVPMVASVLIIPREWRIKNRQRGSWCHHVDSSKPRELTCITVLP